MGLVISIREREWFTLTLPDGRVITITHTERCRPAQGMKLHIEAPKDIHIKRNKVIEADGNR